MDRCPHCKAYRQAGPTCRVCGLPVDAAPHPDVALAELEPTRLPPVEVTPGRLEGLEPTEEVLGDVRIPSEGEPRVAKPRCGSCGTTAAPGARVCPTCGQRLSA